jgi:hypothetical protein
MAMLIELDLSKAGRIVRRERPCGLLSFYQRKPAAQEWIE